MEVTKFEKAVDEDGKMIIKSSLGQISSERFPAHARLRIYPMKSGYNMVTDITSENFGEWMQTAYPSRNPAVWSPKGRSTDRERLVLCRSPYKRYNTVLDIPEIFERIMCYVHETHPRSAIWFARALENLGNWETLEYNYLMQCKTAKGFQSRTSVGKYRAIIMGEKHCGDCGKMLKNKGKNTISDLPRCWSCMQKRFPLIQRKTAANMLMNHIPRFSSLKKMDNFINQILDRLRHMVYGSRKYYEKTAVRMAAKAAKRHLEERQALSERNKEELKEMIEMVSTKVPSIENKVLPIDP